MLEVIRQGTGPGICSSQAVCLVPFGGSPLTCKGASSSPTPSSSSDQPRSAQIRRPPMGNMSDLLIAAKDVRREVLHQCGMHPGLVRTSCSLALRADVLLVVLYRMAKNLWLESWCRLSQNVLNWCEMKGLLLFGCITAERQAFFPTNYSPDSVSHDTAILCSRAKCQTPLILE